MLAVGERTFVETQITFNATDTRCSASEARMAKSGGRRNVRYWEG